VWGTVGNKTDIVLDCPPVKSGGSGRAPSQHCSRTGRRPGQ
jgi:hypothetical protein